MIEYLRNLIVNFFKAATVVSIDDTGNYQVATVSFLGKIQKIMSLKPYGLISNPPPGSLAMTFTKNANESDIVGVIDDPKNRTKNMLPGEVGLYNYLTFNTIKFKADGTTELTTATLNLTGEMITTGNITAAGNITGVNFVGSGNLSGVNITGTGQIVAPIIYVGPVSVGTHVHEYPVGSGTFTGPMVGP